MSLAVALITNKDDSKERVAIEQEKLMLKHWWMNMMSKESNHKINLLVAIQEKKLELEQI